MNNFFTQILSTLQKKISLCKRQKLLFSSTMKYYDIIDNRLKKLKHALNIMELFF